MAFLITCPICGGDFKDGRSYTATSGVAFAPPHPLYEYCDAGMHLTCLAEWPRREEFSKAYFDGSRQFAISSDTLLAEGPDWILRCGPSPKAKDPYYAEVDVVDWPFRLYSRFEAWEAFIAGAFRDGLDGPALIRAEKAMRDVAPIAPTLAALRNLRVHRTP